MFWRNALSFERPVFIIGSYRSGTSITTWCVGQHPNIWVLPETYWIAEFARQANTLYDLGTAQPAAHFARCGLTKADLTTEARRFVDNVIEKAQQRRVRKVLTNLMNGGTQPEGMYLQRAPLEPKARWVDGTPENAHAVADLLQLFPDARFIHLVRTPHEVVRSMANFENAGGVSQALLEAYGTWRRLAGAAWDAEQTFGSDRVRRFFHSDLTEDPEGMMRGIMAYLGEPYRPACLEPLQRKINSSSVDDKPVPVRDTLSGASRDAFDDNQAFFDMLKEADRVTAGPS